MARRRRSKVYLHVGGKSRPRRRIRRRIKRRYSKRPSVNFQGLLNPDTSYYKLKWTDPNRTVVVPGAQNWILTSYQCNSIWKVDGTNAAVMPNLKEICGMYNRYRVLGCKITLVVSNNEAFPVAVAIVPTNLNLAANNATVVNINNNKYAKRVVLSPTGTSGELRTISKYVNFRKLIGSSKNINDEDYSAITDATTGPTADPKNLIYWEIGMYSLTAANFTASGVVFNATFTFYTQFTERRYQVS